MSDDFAPTVEQVKDAYSRVGWVDEPEVQGEKAWQAYYRREAEFDRWLAKVKAEALHDAADAMGHQKSLFVNGPPTRTGRAFYSAWLAARADSIEGGHAL